jgi:predicted lipoprotein with Yx(FWY)xxD motif
MSRQFPLQESLSILAHPAKFILRNHLLPATACCALAALLVAGAANAQITINSKTGTVTNESTGNTISTVDRRFQQIQPTHVPLTNSELDAKTRLELIRLLQSEQGFAMRPFPRGHKGLTLAANGKLDPAGEAYLNMVTAEGLSAKPGDRVVLSDIKFEHSRIVFDLNGGPDPKHRILRHIQIGVGPDVTNPVVQDSGQEPVGARLSLTFQNHVPELTGAEVKALLSPLISFDVKTPVQAFTDTLPTKLKEAILNHHVLVGMSTDMVLFAKGPPETKSREMEGQMPFEEWIYGKPPKDVEFVRINGNRVIRLEIAKMGEPLVIFTKDEVEGLMRTDGTPLEAANKRTEQVGDVERNPDTQAPAAPPSLRKPGETLPAQDGGNGNDRVGVMKPVQFPKPKPAPQPGANPDDQPDQAQPQPASQTPSAASPPANGQPPPADASPPAPPKPQSPPASAGQPN